MKTRAGNAVRQRKIERRLAHEAKMKADAERAARFKALVNAPILSKGK